MIPIPALVFIFDVESIGLHGEGFAVAGGTYNHLGEPAHEFAFHCDSDAADGDYDDREWIQKHVTINPDSVRFEEPFYVREAFWKEWEIAKGLGAVMFVECGIPVEANFLARCIDQESARKWEGPYPCHEIATMMLAAGMDPMATYPRLPREMPAHEPLADSRLSARLLAEAFSKLKTP